MNSIIRTARIKREISQFKSKSPWGIYLDNEEDSLDSFRISLSGPKDSPYEGGVFSLSINIPDNYPFEPPILKFNTSIYHPNIDQDGRICMDLLKMPPRGSWLPSMTLETLMVAVQTLLANPNPDDPLMSDIAKEYRTDLETFKITAKEYTKKHATQLKTTNSA